MFNKLKKLIIGYKGFITGFALSAALVLFIQAKTTDSYFEISKNLDIYNTLLKHLNTLYVDPIEPGQLIKTSIDNMLDELDPYTNYITESDIEEYEFQTTGKYGGIGASMRKKGDSIIVGEVYEFSPADKAGLHPGDRVLAIEDKNVSGKSINDLSLLLKGAPGTLVKVKVKDAYSGQVSEKSIKRGEIELSSVPYAGLVGTNNNVGYVKLTQFTPNCSRLVRAALDSLKEARPDMQSVILDLRNNPGGLLSEAVATCNLFIDKGQLVVSTKGRLKEWEQEFKTMSQPWDTEIPVAVLINRSSASASEIVAGTIQDLDRGIVVGERSYGKGLVQTTRPLGYNARLKLTTAKYYTPSGRCIQALDYSHRNPDGSVGEIPDSLKKEYKTKNGRKVLSGGGVEPDIAVKDEQTSMLAITLYIKGYLFDYATKYAAGNNNISSAKDFNLSDNEFSNFAKWLEGKDYSYKTDTEIALDSLKSIATREKYFDDIKGEYEKLEANLHRDKKQDLYKHKEDVIGLLESEIISRYYYIRGRIEHSLTNDKDLDNALLTLSAKPKYQSILKP